MEIKKEFESYRKLTRAQFDVVKRKMSSMAARVEQAESSLRDVQEITLETVVALDEWQVAVNGTMEFIEDRMVDHEDRIRKLESNG